MIGDRDPHGVQLLSKWEGAHRLPQLAGLCENNHGHSWRVEVSISAPVLTADGTIVEFGDFKAGLDGWISAQLHHAVMLNWDDADAEYFASKGRRVYRFGGGDRAAGEEKLAANLRWPTVEAIARLLAGVAEDVLRSVPHAMAARVSLIRVVETDRNTAWYAPPRPPQPRQLSEQPARSGT